MNRVAWLVRVGVLLVSAAAVSAQPHAHGRQRNGHRGNGGGGGRQGGSHDSGASGIHADVLKWLLAHNPGLTPNFLKTDLPDKTILLPNGQTVPIYRLKQFLDVNFRLTFFARSNEKGSDIVPVMEERLRKLMALPQFYHWIKSYRGEYKISPKGKVSAQEAYDHFRHIDRRLGVTAGRQFHAPVGGGDGIAAPSWAVWRAMNLFEHEACHCIGIGHDSGGLSGPLAGELRSWDRKKLWNYTTIDLNSLTVPAT